jgi:hypothetical protein
MVDRNVIIKGEGGANVVMQYKNSKNAPQVIRLRKSCLNKEGELPKPKGIDELIWPELLEQGTSLLSLQSDLKYSKQILAPLIGPQYIPSQVRAYFYIFPRSHRCRSLPIILRLLTI